MTGFDWQRLLLGDAPWSFLAEVLVRVAAVYSVLFLVVRLFGKRLSGRIGNIELAVTLALGAIVAVPFQDPARGVLPGWVLLLTLVILQRASGSLGVSYAAFEQLTQGRVTALVVDGVVDLKELSAARVSTSQLFAVLRAQGLRQLGEARRVYLEAYGSFSVYRFEPARPGLSLTPRWDGERHDLEHRAAETLACSSCGAVRVVRALEGRAPEAVEPPCSHCGAQGWVPAVAEI